MPRTKLDRVVDEIISPPPPPPPEDGEQVLPGLDYRKLHSQDYDCVEVPPGFPPKAAAFCREYVTRNYDRVEAALAVGYKTRNSASVAAHAILKDPRSAIYIESLHKAAASGAIATATERKILLSAVIRGRIRGARVADRLKAVELLGKIEGDFVEKVDQTTRILVEREDVGALVEGEAEEVEDFADLESFAPENAAD